GAAGHAAAVDVQGDGDLVLTGVADGVVLVRRDQAAGGAGAGLHRANRAEVEALVLAVNQLVLADFQFAAPDALDAPHAGMVVDRRALAGPPGHRDDAVAVLLADVELATRVVAFDCLEHAVGQAHAVVVDQLAERAPQRVGDGA